MDKISIVSVSKAINVNRINAFILNKYDYIRNALDNFRNNDTPKSELQYVSVENVTFLDEKIRINIVKDSKEYADCDELT